MWWQERNYSKLFSDLHICAVVHTWQMHTHKIYKHKGEISSKLQECAISNVLSIHSDSRFFNELSFTLCRIHSSRPQYSVSSGLSIMLYIHNYGLIFSYAKKKSQFILSCCSLVPKSHSPWLWVIYFLTVDMALLDTSYEWSSKAFSFYVCLFHSVQCPRCLSTGVVSAPTLWDTAFHAGVCRFCSLTQ